MRGDRLGETGCCVRFTPVETVAGISHCNRHVRFTPKSGHVQCNSVCPLCANSGHWTGLFDDFVRATDQRGWHSEAKSFGSREVHNQFNLRGLLNCGRRGLFSL